MEKPFISPEIKLPEITLKVIILSVLLAIILAVSNAYLALKIGLLTSASIPAAILSMGILRLFRHSNILENNLVQTAASAGEAVAGGVVFTVPALVIIHYWLHFAYWENFFIALAGGVLGVLFSIPLRKVLMAEKRLKFPEGRAIAAVLQMGETKEISLKQLLLGASAGAIIQLFQTGFKIIANSLQLWFMAARTVFGFGAGFSATMIGAGYLAGFDVGFSIFLGAIIGWIIAVPVLSSVYAIAAANGSPTDLVLTLFASKIRYIGIGAMLVAGVWTLLTLLKPFYLSIESSLKILGSKQTKILRTEQDMPMWVVLLGSLALLIFTFFLFAKIFPLQEIGLSDGASINFLLLSILIVLVVGFIFSAITSYFSGLVGVTASPGSSIVIAGLLISGLVVHAFMGFGAHTETVLKAGAAIAIIIGAVLTGIACIANDNIQDLKVGHIVGATPWKQQLMLLLGAVVAAAVIPVIMQLLFSVYGIAGVVPRAGMPLSQTLPAPPAAVMAAITSGVFQGNLPWHLVLAGGIIMLVIIVINFFVKKYYSKISILSVAIGIYLPLATSIPLFIGGLFALLVQRKIKRIENTKTISENHPRNQKGLLLACGLVAGSALMDVILAVPFAIAESPEILKINIPHWQLAAEGLGLLVTIGLGIWFYHLVTEDGKI